MSDSDNKVELKRTKEDIAYTITKAGLSSIPLVGGAASELMSLVWEPALSKRRDEWIRELAGNLQILEEKVEEFRIDKLSENETFITVSLQASQAAIQNHQKEKLNALRNTVLNSALGVDLNEEVQLLSLSLIERLTVSHIKFLKLFSSNNMSITISDNEENMSDAIARDIYIRHIEKNVKVPPKENRKKWNDQRNQEIEILRIIIDDLSNIGLIDIKIPSISGRFLHYPICLTILGKQFIKFISTPVFLMNEEAA